jgi:hypothetical protein
MATTKAYEEQKKRALALKEKTGMAFHEALKLVRASDPDLERQNQDQFRARQFIEEPKPEPARFSARVETATSREVDELGAALMHEDPKRFKSIEAARTEVRKRAPTLAALERREAMEARQPRRFTEAPKPAPVAPVKRLSESEIESKLAEAFRSGRLREGVELGAALKAIGVV